MKIEIPNAFDNLCGLFYQGISVHIPTTEAQIEWVLEGQPKDDLEISKAFLDELLSGKYNKEQLTEIWRLTQTSVMFFDGTDREAPEPGIVYFLKLFRSLVERKLRESK
jgi:hypothetical protein